MGKGGKSKKLALKGIKEEIDDSKDEDENEDEDEDEDENEDLTFITNEIIKLLQFRITKSDIATFLRLENLEERSVSSHVS